MPARTTTYGNMNAISFDGALCDKYTKGVESDESAKRTKDDSYCARSSEINAVLETLKYVYYQCSINPKEAVQTISTVRKADETNLTVEQECQSSTTASGCDASLQDSDKVWPVTVRRKKLRDKASNTYTYYLDKIKAKTSAMFRAKQQNSILNNRVEFSSGWKLEDKACPNPEWNLVQNVVDEMSLKSCRAHSRNLKIEASTGLNGIQDIIREGIVAHAKLRPSNRETCTKKKLEVERKIPIGAPNRETATSDLEKECVEGVCEDMISNDLFKFRWQEGLVHENVDNKIKEEVVKIRQCLTREKDCSESEERAFKNVWQEE